MTRIIEISKKDYGLGDYDIIYAKIFDDGMVGLCEKSVRIWAAGESVHIRAAGQLTVIQLKELTAQL